MEVQQYSEPNVKIAGTINAMKRYPSVPIIFLLLALFTSMSPYFLTSGNMESILAANSVVMIAAIGMTLVFLTGGIDLSVSTVISVSAVLAGIVMASTGSVLLGTITAVSAGIGFGALNGFLIGYCGLTPFITTMGTGLIARGIAFLLSQGIAIKGTPDSVFDFGFALFIGIPAVTWVSIILLIVTGVVVAKSTWGREVILFGANRNAARYSGVKTKRIEMSVYVLSGLFAGIAGMISIANLGNAIPGVGDTLLLIIIGGVVLGGTSMNGGEGSIMRTVLGVGILALLTNGLNLVGLPFYDQLIIQGILIFVGNSIAVKFGRRKEN